MKRNLIFVAVSALMLNVAMSSCNNSNENAAPDDGPDAIATENISKSLACAKVMPERVTDYQEAREYRGKARDFYWRFAEAVGGSSTGNIAVSPMSAFMVLGMAAESAQGQTREELLKALGVDGDVLAKLSPILCHDLNRILSQSVNEFGDIPENSESLPKNLIKSVNSIWACDRIHFNEEGLHKISKEFYSDIFWTDFASGEGNKLINAYVKNETRGFLDINLDVPKDAVMALMNVLYIKEIWNDYGGDLGFTKDKYDFQNTDKSTQNTSLLQGYFRDGKAIKEEKFRKFFTITNSGYKLTFIVPNDGYSANDVYNHESFTSNSYTYTEGNKRYHTRCLFPEFKADFFESIKDNIQKLGINLFFTDGKCDFGGLVASIDNAPGVYCSDVKQAARFEVQKSGIEGAAVTIAIMNEASAGPDLEEYEDVYENFVVDRAFAYTFEDSYGNVLFTGVVNSIK